MKIITKLYFYLFPLVFTPLLLLLYTGNIFLFNIVAVIIIVLIVINRMMLNRFREVENNSIKLSFDTVKNLKYHTIFNIILFVLTYGFLTIKFIFEEVLAGIGSV